MRRIIIDTNIYVAFKRADPHVMQVFRACDEVHLNVTVFTELIASFKAGNKESANRQELSEFLNSPRVQFDPIDEGTAEFYAHIYLLLRLKGNPIPTNDIWLAASAMQHGLALFTRDNHFRSIDSLLLA
jgi:predicted nucleic acid-binding protein